MSKYLGSLIVVVLAVACGGAADTGVESGGGSAQGGSDAGSDPGGSAGKGGGGANHAGGNAGGSNAGGSNPGGSNAGGSSAGGSSAGGSRSYDPRCPAHQPTGVCSAADAGLSCQYELGSGCLCYPQPAGVFGLCERVDPSCTYVPPGAAGAGGVGGFSAKVALPPRLLCGCSSEMWVCGQAF